MFILNLASSWENRLFAYAKTKTQSSFAVTAKLISAFGFATRIVQSLYFLNPKFQASRHILWLYSPVCVGPGRKPRRPVFSQRGSFIIFTAFKNSCIPHSHVCIFLLRWNIECNPNIIFHCYTDDLFLRFYFTLDLNLNLVLY